MDSAGAGIPDERLVDQVRAGDGVAYEELIRRHKGKIFGMAARIARDALELEEIAQEVFVKAYENLASYRGDAPFGHWLSRIATNTCHDYLRKRKQRRAEVSVDLYEWMLEAPAETHGAAPEELAALARALERLRPGERLVLTLLELEEKSVKETAYIMDISEGNVKVRAHRARKALKELLEKELKHG
ncbi:MAG: sigma-70 family RNA polymerase sigma factor [Nitrospinae bacterium]|nr:sigma-70 family RNA polymerase sigma factor [Nitrospinota bacterium]